VARTDDLPSCDLDSDTADSAVRSRDTGPSIVGGLFKSRAKLVRSVLRWRLRNEDDAKEAAQDVFLRLWQREKAGALDGDARAYMMSSAYNAATDRERWRARRPQEEHLSQDDLLIVASHGPDLDDVLFWRQALNRLVEMLNELPTPTRQVFVLYHVEGSPHVDIARHLGMSVRSVERHMARAISHCRQRMKDYLE